MPRWLIALIAVVPFCLLVVVAFGPFYLLMGVYKLKGPAIEWLCGIFAFLVMVVASFLTAWIVNRLKSRDDARAAERGQAQFEADLARLRADPARAHWARLAERYRRVDDEMIARWEKRYRQLLADPKRHAFAASCLDGSFPLNQQIDYLQDREMLVTCEHLRPLERALRATPGADCACIAWDENVFSRRVCTTARLDSDAARARFQLPDFVEWQVEPPHPHSSEEESFVCARCGSSLVSGFGARFP